MSQPLALSDSELLIVWNAAHPLRVEDREGYLQEVAERLSALPQHDDGIAYQIAREVQRRHFEPPDTRADYEPEPQRGALRRAAAR